MTVSTMIPTLEMQLHQPATRNNSKIVSELLHDDFEEIGRSGRHYDKRQTVAALEQETGRPVIHAEDFKLAMMTEGVALLTYKAFSVMPQAISRGSRCVRLSGCYRSIRQASVGSCVFIRARRQRSHFSLNTHAPNKRNQALSASE